MSAKFHLLVAEDDANDQVLLDQLLVRAGIASVTYVKSGEEVVAYLSGAGRFGDRDVFPPPDVLLLDLGLPLLSGLEVLEWVFGQRMPGRPAVYVLTGSPDPALRDKAESHAIGGFFEKPLALAQVTLILEEWRAGHRR